MTTYRAYHKVLIEPDMGSCFTDIPGIAEAKAGFWVNYKFEYTQGSDCKWWIPAAQILYVDKITDDFFVHLGAELSRSSIPRPDVSKCTCHERDSSYRCEACKAKGECGHMEEPYPGIGEGRYAPDTKCDFLSGGSMSDGQITCNNPRCKDCYPDPPAEGIPTRGPFC